MPPPVRKANDSKSSSSSGRARDSLVTMVVDMGQNETRYGIINTVGNSSNDSDDDNSENGPHIEPTVTSITYPSSSINKKSTATKKSSSSSSNSNKSAGAQSAKLMKQLRRVGQSDTEMTLFRYPIQNGRVADWDALQLYYEHIMMNTTAVSHAHAQQLIVTSDPVCAPVSDRAQQCELLLEQLDMSRLVFESSGVLNMRQQKISGGSGCGLSVDIGQCRTTITPIAPGYQPLYHLSSSVSIGGVHINTYLMQLLRQSGYMVDPTEEHRVSEHIKRSMAYCAVDIQKELSELERHASDFSQELELSTGEKILIQNGEAFKCVEPLFNPIELIGHLNARSVQKSVYDCLEQEYFAKNGGDRVKRDMYSNIVLSGGTSLLVGIRDRLCAELREGLKHSSGTEQLADLVQVNYATGDLENESTAGAWYGAQQWMQDINSGKCQPITNWITKELLAEHGKDRIVRKNCY